MNTIFVIIHKDDSNNTAKCIVAFQSKADAKTHLIQAFNGELNIIRGQFSIENHELNDSYAFIDYGEQYTDTFEIQEMTLT